MHYTVGLKANGKSDHVTVDGAEALAAALKVRGERPDAMITYVRRQNRRGDSRHPGHGLRDHGIDNRDPARTTSSSASFQD